jgi:hypothetical protein
MPNADMPEGIEHAFIGEDAIGSRQFSADLGERIGHGFSFFGIEFCAGGHCPRTRMFQ